MNTACPEPEILKRFVHADVPEEKAREIARHIESCTACRRAVEYLEQETGDSFLGKLRSTEPIDSKAESLLPERIGQYKILERIGEGGMGTVYRAYQESLQREVALKVVKDSRLDSTESFERFKREMLIVGRLQHSNIVQAYDAGTEGTMPFFVMEFLDGNDLTEVVRQNGPLSEFDAIRFIKQTADGLAYAHKAGIVHRDIKPSNLFLTTHGTVKLLDLGLSRLIQTSNEKLETTYTEFDQIVGSPDFMAPEQIQHKKINAGTDIYSLGCALYFLLTGETPYPSSRYSTVAEKIAAHLHVPLPQHPAVKPPVRRLLERMTAKDPVDRFQSVEELLNALDALPSFKHIPHVKTVSMAVGILALFALLILLWPKTSVTDKAKSNGNTEIASVPGIESYSPEIDYIENPADLMPFDDMPGHGITHVNFDISDPKGWDVFFTTVIDFIIAHGTDMKEGGDGNYVFLILDQLGRHDDAQKLLDGLMQSHFSRKDFNLSTASRAVQDCCSASLWERQVGRPEEAEKYLQKANEIISSLSLPRGHENLQEQIDKTRNRSLKKLDFENPPWQGLDFSIMIDIGEGEDPNRQYFDQLVDAIRRNDLREAREYWSKISSKAVSWQIKGGVLLATALLKAGKKEDAQQIMDVYLVDLRKRDIGGPSVVCVFLDAIRYAGMYEYAVSK